MTHLTLRGPQRGKSDLFSRYVSPYSTESILSLVYSTYPAISTGVIREFHAVEGEFEGGKSLAQTLGGYLVLS